MTIWHCKACGFGNGGQRIACNGCARPRREVDPAYSPPTCDICKARVPHVHGIFMSIRVTSPGDKGQTHGFVGGACDTCVGVASFTAAAFDGARIALASRPVARRVITFWLRVRRAADRLLGVA